MRTLLVGAAVCAAALAGAPAAAATVAAQADQPPVRVVTVRDPRIAESSGLALSPSHRDLVWTVDDSGSAAVVYGVSTRDGRTRAVLRLEDSHGAALDARDMEAMAAGRDGAGRPVVWVGDIGDNRTVRTSVVLRLLVEPTSVRSQAVRAVSLRLRYPDGPSDAETLVWTPDRRLLVVTKSLLGAQVYEVPAAAVRRALAGHDVTEPVVAQPVATLPEMLLTDGTALPDGRVVVRGYGSATIYRWAGRRLEADGELRLPEQPQGETITAERSGTSVLVGSEGVRQPLWRVQVPAAAQSPSSTPTSRTSAASTHTSARTTSRTTADAGAGGWTPAWAAVGAVGITAVVLGGVAAVVRGARRRGRRTR